MFQGVTLAFQTPHIGGLLSQKAEEVLWIAAGLFQYVANYTKKMEQTMIELLGFKLLRERNEVEKQELEGKVVVAQQEVLDLHNHIRVIELHNRKTLMLRKGS